MAIQITSRKAGLFFEGDADLVDNAVGLAVMGVYFGKGDPLDKREGLRGLAA